MSLRVVPTHVRSAIPIVETESQRTTAERDALARFRNRVSDLDVSASDQYLDGTRKPSARTLVVTDTAGHATSHLARVRDAYRETVMSVSHYRPYQV